MWLIITRTYYCKKKIDIVELYARYLSLKLSFHRTQCLQPSYRTVFQVVKKIKDGKESIKNNIRSGNPKTVIQKIAENHRCNREKRYTVKDIAWIIHVGR